MSRTVVITICRMRQFLCCAFVLLALLPAEAQNFQIRSWHVEDGLPDGTVTSLAQTRDGYLWVGTRKGLARFDGTRFQPVEFEAGTAPGDSGVAALFTDSHSDLWVATYAGRVFQKTQERFRLRYQPPAPASESGAQRPAAIARPWQHPGWLRVNAFASDSAGQVWLLTIRGDIVRFNGTNSPVKVSLEGLPRGEMRGLLNDRSGRIWLLKGARACAFEASRWVSRPAAGIEDVDGPVLGAAGDQMVWAGGRQGGQVMVNQFQISPDGEWRVTPLTLPEGRQRRPVSAIMEDRQGRLWVAHNWGGLFSKEPGGAWKRVETSGRLEFCQVQSLLEDRDGNIWVGAMNEGLLQIVSPRVKMVSSPPGTADSVVRSVSADGGDGLWIALWGGLYHWRSNQCSSNLATGPLAGNNIQAVLADDATNVWVGTSAGLFHGGGAGFKRVTGEYGSGSAFLALFRDRSGNIWTGGSAGVFCLRGDTNWITYKATNQTTELDVRCLAEDSAGRIWAALRGVGLWRVENDQIVSAGPHFDELAAGARALHFDREGVLWIGTLYRGLFRWDGNELRNYTVADGLPDDAIYGLTSDSQGNLWMASNNGIFGCSLRKLNEFVRDRNAPLLCWRIGFDSGLAFRSCSGTGQPIMAGTDDGRLWVANTLAVAGFEPEQITRRDTSLVVLIEALMVDGVKLRPEAGEFRVPASTRRFEFHYSAPKLDFPQSLRFRYQLEGLDKAWVEAGTMRMAPFGQLSPGEYRFRVEASGVDEVWHEAELPLRLRVVPRFWQTAWFQIGVLVFAAAGLVMGVRLKERRKARRQLERLEAQQAIERERRRIAQDLHDDLGSNITEIVQMGDLTLDPASAPELLHSHVGTLTGRLRQLGIALDEVVWTVNPRNDTLPNLVGFISNHAQEFLRHSGIKCRLEVKQNLPGVTVGAHTRHNLFLAAKEALNNVARHSGASEAWVRIQYEAPVLRVVVEDNGRGFDVAAANEGDGLTNMRERMQAVQGKAEYQSQPGAGSRVSLTLDLSGSSNGRAATHHQ